MEISRAELSAVAATIPQIEYFAQTVSRLLGELNKDG